MVANHTFALLEADERGVRVQLEDEFPVLDDPLMVDALTYCDMTTTPDGAPTTAPERLAEIKERYGPNTLVGRFMQRAQSRILAVVAGVEQAMTVQPR